MVLSLYLLPTCAVQYTPVYPMDSLIKPASMNSYLVLNDFYALHDKRLLKHPPVLLSCTCSKVPVDYRWSLSNGNNLGFFGVTVIAALNIFAGWNSSVHILLFLCNQSNNNGVCGWIGRLRCALGFVSVQKLISFYSWKCFNIWELLRFFSRCYSRHTVHWDYGVN